MTGGLMAVAGVLAIAVSVTAAVVFARLAISQHEARLADPVREAERRWAASNAAARAAGCPCGATATEVRYDPRVVGSVPHETWTCTEHVGVAVWRGRQAAWEYPRRLPGVECWGWSGPIGGEPSRWHHPVKPSDARARFGVEAVGDADLAELADGPGLEIVELADGSLVAPATVNQKDSGG